MEPQSALPKFRSENWREEATSKLLDVWGCRFIERNRGSLRQNDWIEITAAVNALNEYTQQNHRTVKQAKYHMDWLKKRYKQEKNKIANSNGTLTSSWQFFSRLHLLIGSSCDQPQQTMMRTPMQTDLNLPLPPMAEPLPQPLLPPPPCSQPLPVMKIKGISAREYRVLCERKRDEARANKLKFLNNLY